MDLSSTTTRLGSQSEKKASTSTKSEEVGKATMIEAEEGSVSKIRKTQRWTSERQHTILRRCKELFSMPTIL